jgi:NAD(P)-dependent dehydrogenase (short-subunit alcohol dehydrogenase family)
MGSAVVLDRARAGWRLGLVGRDQAALADIRSAAKAAGAPEVSVSVVDLSRRDSVLELADLAERLRPVDLLVHAAGAARRGSLEEVGEDDWQEALSVKLLGAVRLVRAARPSLAFDASVVLVAGGAAQQPDSGYVLGAVNAALEHLTKTLALELAADGIRVNAVSPGPTRTARFEARCRREADRRGTTPEAVAAEIAAALPLGRLTEPEDVATAVAFIASAPTLSGDVLRISSGQAARSR